MNQNERFRKNPFPSVRFYPAEPSQPPPIPEMTRETAFKYIDGWLEEHQRAFVYDYYIHDFRETNPKGIPPGLYGNTNVFGFEIKSDPMLQAAYSAVYTSGLASLELIQDGQITRITPVDGIHSGPERYVMVRIDILSATIS